MRSIQLTGVTFASWRVYISYTLFANIELPLFQYKTSCIYFRISTLFRKKSISLSYAFCSPAWWKQVRSVIYFEIGILLHYPSSLKSSKFLSVEGWFNRYSTWTVVYQHIDGRCVIYKRLAWMSVVIIIFLKVLLRPQDRIMVQQHPCLFCIRSVPLHNPHTP